MITPHLGRRTPSQGKPPFPMRLNNIINLKINFIKIKNKISYISIFYFPLYALY